VIEINGKILTACVEIWKCKSVHLKFNTKVKTLQADIMTGLKVVYATAADMQSIVWQDVDNTDISFADNSNPQLLTGHAHMQAVYPDSDMKIDQFIIRFVPELGPGLQPERCVRLKNGFLSTEREAADWDQRNEKARDLFVENFLKEGGIHLNKDKNATKKIPPNSICACGSKKKYKNCCSNKKAISGLHDTQKPKVYVQDKSGVKVETKENDGASAMSALAITDTTTTPASTSSSSTSIPSTSTKATKTKENVSKPTATSSPPIIAAQPEFKAESESQASATEAKPAKKAEKPKNVSKSFKTEVAPSSIGQPEQTKEPANVKKLGTSAPGPEAKAGGEPKAAEVSKTKPLAATQPAVTTLPPATSVADEAPVMIHAAESTVATTTASKPKKKKVVKKKVSPIAT